MGCMEFRRLLDCRLVQHQHMDDFLIKHCRRSFMVAVMDLCLGMMLKCCLVTLLANASIAWLLHRSLLRLLDWPDWCNVPHFFSRRQSRVFRCLGCSMARL